MRPTRTARYEGDSTKHDTHWTQGTPLSPLSGAVRDEDLCRRVLEVITDLTTCHGRPPTHREVLASLGLSSHRRLSESLDDLVRTGRLQRLSGSRNIILATEPT